MVLADRVLPDRVLADRQRATLRVGQAQARSKALRDEVATWVETRTAESRFARFTRHFEVLRLALTRLLDKVDGRLDELAQTTDLESGFAYDRSRAAESSLQVIRRIFDWYAHRYEQRLDARLEATLRAADEIVRSCWLEPFSALGMKPPAGPLVFLDPRFDALATPRVTAPPDLRAPGDKLIADFVRELPIGVIAVPAACTAEPWWLILTVHETGHHIMSELSPSLADMVRATLVAAAREQDLADDWERWAVEAFADGFSVLMAGSAPAWAVDELQHATPAEMVKPPELGDRYPPPLVRLAFMGEIAHALGIRGTFFDLAAATEWSTDQAVPDIVRRHLAITPTVAEHLVSLDVNGKSFRLLGDFDGGRFATSGSASAVWATQLTRAAPIIPGQTQRWAARIGIAGGVAALQQAQQATTGSNTLARLVANLPRQLSACGGPGVLATPPEAADVTRVVDRLAEDLPDASARTD